MKLSIRAFTLACVILWAGALFFTGVLELFWDGYAGAFLDVMSSLYPGYAPAGFGSVIVLTLYGIVDAAIGAALFAWLYNRFTGAVPAGGAG